MEPLTRLDTAFRADDEECSHPEWSPDEGDGQEYCVVCGMGRPTGTSATLLAEQPVSIQLASGPSTGSSKPTMAAMYFGPHRNLIDNHRIKAKEWCSTFVHKNFPEQHALAETAFGYVQKYHSWRDKNDWGPVGVRLNREQLIIGACVYIAALKAGFRELTSAQFAEMLCGAKGIHGNTPKTFLRLLNTGLTGGKVNGSGFLDDCVCLRLRTCTQPVLNEHESLAQPSEVDLLNLLFQYVQQRARINTVDQSRLKKIRRLSENLVELERSVSIENHRKGPLVCAVAFVASEIERRDENQLNVLLPQSYRMSSSTHAAQADVYGPKKMPKVTTKKQAVREREAAEAKWLEMGVACKLFACCTASRGKGDSESVSSSYASTLTRLVHIIKRTLVSVLERMPGYEGISVESVLDQLDSSNLCDVEPLVKLFFSSEKRDCSDTVGSPYVANVMPHTVGNGGANASGAMPEVDDDASVGDVGVEEYLLTDREARRRQEMWDASQGEDRTGRKRRRE